MRCDRATAHSLCSVGGLVRDTLYVSNLAIDRKEEDVLVKRSWRGAVDGGDW